MTIGLTGSTTPVAGIYGGRMICASGSSFKLAELHGRARRRRQRHAQDREARAAASVRGHPHRLGAGRRARRARPEGRLAPRDARRQARRLEEAGRTPRQHPLALSTPLDGEVRTTGRPPEPSARRCPGAFPVALRGSDHEQLAMPFETRCAVAVRCLPPTVAEQATVPASTGPFVSLSFAARLATNFLPAFAGFGPVVNALTLSVSLRQHLIREEAVTRVRRKIVVDVREVGVTPRVDRDPRRPRPRRS